LPRPPASANSASIALAPRVNIGPQLLAIHEFGDPRVGVPDQVMRDAFVMGLVRTFGELSPDDYAAAMERLRDKLDDRSPG
jgi:hypothetical protein